MSSTTNQAQTRTHSAVSSGALNVGADMKPIGYPCVNDVRHSLRVRTCVALLLHSGIGLRDCAAAMGLSVATVRYPLLSLYKDGIVSRKRRDGGYCYYGTQVSERLVRDSVAAVELEERRLLESMLLHKLCKRDRVNSLLGR